MLNGGWKTKNWSDFTCYSEDEKSALSMEQWKNETWRWCLYGTGPDGGWTPAIHCMNQGVFQIKQQNILLQADIITRKLDGTVLKTEGEVLRESRRIACCQTAMRRLVLEGVELFSIKYRYAFETGESGLIQQEYEVPQGIPFSIKIIPPQEGFAMEWDEQASSMNARLSSESICEGTVEFETLFGVQPL